ncbi:InlB B-repeat-containing protein [bacterium]|nr:InlB B-repeat-containing protein [bacterium]
MTFTPYSNSVTIGHPMEEANGRYVLDLYDIEKYLVPIRTGYEFIGWYSDKELTKKFDFDTILTENIILYAKRSNSISHDTIN